MNEQNIIEITNLSKSFKDVKAVQDISFRVKKGELFAFLGINGAGKSTTISIISGELQKDKGKVIINNCDIDYDSDKIKSSIGVVYQNSVLDKQLTVYDNLKYRAALYGIYGQDFKNRLNELTEIFSFNDYLYREVRKLSGGQKRRIDIARALIHKPSILILDEPTTGLDPQTRKMVWRIINEIRKDTNMTVFLTTHYMEEAADCDYIVIIDNGKIVGEGTTLELKNTYAGDFITLYNTPQEDIEKLNLPYKKIRNSYRLSIKSTVEATNLIIKYPDIFKDYEIVKGNMDDVFLSSTGKSLGGASEWHYFI